MILEIALACGITLSLYLLLKYTLLRWKKQMEKQTEVQEGKNEENTGQEDDRLP